MDKSKSCSGCLESDSEVSVARDPAYHELDHGDLEEGCDGLGGALDITGKASVDAGPGEGALDDPALGLHDETGVGALDDLDRTRGSRGDSRSLVTGVREDA